MRVQRHPKRFEGDEQALVSPVRVAWKVPAFHIQYLKPPTLWTIEKRILAIEDLSITEIVEIGVRNQCGLN
jgi:hypothetical protein